MLDHRIFFDDEEDRLNAEAALEAAGLDFDYDSGDRMMISEEGLEVLDENVINYDCL